MSARMHAARASALRVEWPAALEMVWSQTPQSYAFENDVFKAAAFVKSPTDVADYTTVKLWGRLEDQPEEVLMGEAKISPTESSTNILARLTAHAQYRELLAESELSEVKKSADARESLAVQYRLITDETNFVLVHERAEGEQAQEMPVAYKVAQMHPAGHAGVGSIAFSNRAVAPRAALPAQFNRRAYEQRSTIFLLAVCPRPQFGGQIGQWPLHG